MSPQDSHPSPGPAGMASSAPAFPAWFLFFSQPIAWIVLGISLAASAGGWFLARQHSDLEARKRFEEESGRLTSALTERMLIYQDVLHGAAGLYSASLSVERSEWRAYLEKVGVEKRYPGIDGVGFAASVPRIKLGEFLRVTRADKTPDFRVKESGTNQDLIIIKYFEPEQRHQALLGVDMGMEPQQRAGAEQARDTGSAIMTGKMIVAEDGRGRQWGFLMLLPVYRNGPPLATIQQRRAAIEGWVFARFTITYLMQGIREGKGSTLHFEIFDSQGVGTDRVIYSDALPPSGSTPDGPSRFTSETLLKLGGRSWLLKFATTPAFEAAVYRSTTTLVGIGGSLISLLLFAIACSLSTTRARALAMASNMTAALRETNEQLKREIKERERAEQVLKDSEALYHSLVESLPLQIIRKDLQGRFTFANHHFCVNMRKTLPEVIGRTDADFLPPGLAVQNRIEDQRVIETGTTMENVQEIPQAGGAPRFVQTLKTLMCDGAGNVAGLLDIRWDVTDKHRAEEALRQAKEAAEEANHAKSQFLASMSHELRTPLNSVIGFANILLKNKSGNLASSEINFLDRIAANGRHLLALINQVLDLSKIEARKVELQLSLVALDGLVRDTIAQQEGLFRDRPIQLLSELPAMIAPIMADADKLKQVLINLMGNALKFTENGSVTVRVKTDPATHQPLQLDVVDTGIGIAKDKLHLIFEAFQQAEAGTARKYGGTGLGLTISQALCRLMGFRLEVASEPGKGSTFSVIFNRPTHGAMETRSLAPVPLPSSVIQPKLVLVIDDELDSRILLEHIVEELGCRVITAPSGEAGLRMAREFHPQLITVDLKMPRMDGWEVVRSIKADKRLCDIPVVVVSIVAGEYRGGILGAVDVLQKPVSREDLLAVLQEKFP